MNPGHERKKTFVFFSPRLRVEEALVDKDDTLTIHLGIELRGCRSNQPKSTHRLKRSYKSMFPGSKVFFCGPR